MGELKPGWKRVKFGEVVRLAKERCAPVTEGIERYIGLEHIEPGELRVRSWGDVTDGTTFTTRVRPGHVLFGKRRAYQRKVAVADFDAVCSGDIYVFESANPEKLLPALLPYLCQTESFFDYAVGTSAGSLSPRTNWTSLAEYEIALPPPDEQRRLAAALTAGRELAEALRSARDAGQALADRFVDALIEGRVKDVPSELADGLDPSRWNEASLGQLCTLGNGHGFRPPDWSDAGMPIIRIQNVRGSKNFNYFAGQPEEKWIVRPGELLFAWAGVPGVSFGPGIWEGPPGVLNQHIYRVTPVAGVNREWLYEVLRYLTPRIERRAHGFKASLLHIRQSEFTGQRVRRPPPAEQEIVANVVRTVRGWVDRLDGQSHHADAVRATLMAQVVA